MYYQSKSTQTLYLLCVLVATLFLYEITEISPTQLGFKLGSRVNWIRKNKTSIYLHNGMILFTWDRNPHDFTFRITLKVLKSMKIIVHTFIPMIIIFPNHVGLDLHLKCFILTHILRKKKIIRSYTNLVQDYSN